MSIAQQVISAPHDKIFKSMEAAVEVLEKRICAWERRPQGIRDLVTAFEAIGDVRVDGLCRIDIVVSGDKALFVTCWKLWREAGVRLDPATEGATQLSQFVDIGDICFWFHFSSTVCKRVQVGTQMQEVPIYETHCGESLSGMEALEGPDGPPNLSTVHIGSDNEIPL